MPLGLYTELRGVRALRPLLDRGHHRAARRAGHLSRSRPHEGRADLVHARLCRIPVSQQCQAGQRRDQRARSGDGTELGSARHQRRLAVRHHAVASTARISAPGPRPAISATSAASITPDWWKLKGSQYGKLKSWRVAGDGTYVDGVKISDVTLADLDLADHHSIRLRIGVKDDATPSRRHQHFRPGLRQLRPGHRAAPEDRLISGF